MPTKAKTNADNNSEEPVTRDSQGLRNILFDEIDFLRAGTSNPTRANAIAKMVAGVVETVELEMTVQDHLNRSAQILDGKAPVTSALPQIQLDGR
jgi:hypothetical protein